MSPQLQGVLIGGAIGLATTLLNLLFNWVNAKSQRQFAIRQSVYLDAATWAAKSVEFLASFGRLDLDDQQLGQAMQSSTVAVYKVHAVGGPAAVSAVTAATECLAERSLDLMTRRIALQRRLRTIEDGESESSQLATNLQQLSSMIDALPSAAASAEDTRWYTWPRSGLHHHTGSTRRVE